MQVINLLFSRYLHGSVFEQFKKRRNGNSYNGYILCVNQSIKRQQYLVGKDLCLVNHFLFASIITNFLSKYELFIVLFIFAFPLLHQLRLPDLLMLHLQVTIGGPTGLKVFRLICRNATQYNQLSTGLQEAQLLAECQGPH